MQPGLVGQHGGERLIGREDEDLKGGVWTGRSRLTRKKESGSQDEKEGEKWRTQTRRK